MASDLCKEERKIKMRINTAAKRLRCLEDIKDRIEKLMQRYLQETCDIEKRIAETEKLIECLLHALTVAADKRKISEEIAKLKEEKKCAETDVLKLKKELYCKMRKLEKTKKMMPRCAKKDSFRQDGVLSRICVALMPDYTILTSVNAIHYQLPTISFEIKPKCGIDIDGKCKFCCKQAKKLQAGRISNITNYCPKKLYSGDYNLMQQAVLDLLENPQNNIQIYKNSKLIYSDKHNIAEIRQHFACWDEKNAITTIIDVIAEILRFKYKNQHQCNIENCSKTFTVLDQLKQLQDLDNCNNPPVTEERGYVNLLLSMIANGITENRSNCARCKLTSQIKSPLCRHYLSKIARDCSIMISVKQLPTNCDSDMKTVCVNGVYYMFDVKVFDLFPKREIEL